MNDGKVDALHIMTMAQGQVLETVLGIVLGQMSAENSALVRADLGRNEVKFLSGYTGGPADAEALQATAKLVQSEIDRILEGSEVVEKVVRGA